jgi:hypothetical protein
MMNVSTTAKLLVGAVAVAALVATTSTRFSASNVPVRIVLSASADPARVHQLELLIILTIFSRHIHTFRYTHTHRSLLSAATRGP